MSEEYTPGAGPSSDARMWATIVHLACLAGFTAIPFANIVAPLVIWLLKKNDDPFIDEHGKEAVNFQICLFIYGLVTALLTMVLIGLLLLPVLLLFWLVTMIMAAIAANKGESYRYPFIFRLIK